jgi:hypothetical protein
LINLTGVESLTTIGGSLVIGSKHGMMGVGGNPSLKNLTGLNSLTNIGGDLRVINNNSLVSLTGLENLITVDSSVVVGSAYWFYNFHCAGNASLINLNGMNALTFIGKNLEIACNDSLENLDGLENLGSIVGSLLIGKVYGWMSWMEASPGNPSLIDLSDLSNLTSIGGALEITGNDTLPDLSGLENIDPVSINDLSIYNNNYLSSCEVESICNYLLNPNGEIEIHDNAEGCDSSQQVQDSCVTVSIEEVNLLDKLFISPNPFSTSTTIKFESSQSGKVEIKIFNQLGEVIEVIQKNTQAGEQTFNWDANGLPSGVYFISVQVTNKLITRKVVKL